MTTNIQFVKMPTSESMEQYTIAKLKKIAEKYQWVIRTDVFFKKENSSTHNGCICEMELSLPGPKIFAKSNEKNFEMAVKETVSDIEDQLKKRKANFQPLVHSLSSLVITSLQLAMFSPGDSS